MFSNDYGSIYELGELMCVCVCVNGGIEKSAHHTKPST